MASRTTRDHEEVMRWAHERGAYPSIVSRTGGMLRFEFDPQRASELEEVDWQDFFKVFDEKGLDLLYDEKPGSRFHKFVYPETLETKQERRPVARPARAGKVGGRAASSNDSRQLGRGQAGATGSRRSSRTIATRRRAASGTKATSRPKATATRSATAPKRSAGRVNRA